MNGKFLVGLSVFAVAFALVLGYSAFDQARAVPGIGDEGYNWLPSDQVNLFGYDGAQNSALDGRDMDYRDYAVSDFRDPDPNDFPVSYHP